MDVQQFRDDATAGKLPLGKLIDVIETQQKRIAELEAIIKSKNPTERLQQPYSEKADEKRRPKTGPEEETLAVAAGPNLDRREDQTSQTNRNRFS